MNDREQDLEFDLRHAQEEIVQIKNKWNETIAERDLARDEAEARKRDLERVRAELADMCRKCAETDNRAIEAERKNSGHVLEIAHLFGIIRDTREALGVGFLGHLPELASGVKARLDAADSTIAEKSRACESLRGQVVGNQAALEKARAELASVRVERDQVRNSLRECQIALDARKKVAGEVREILECPLGASIRDHARQVRASLEHARDDREKSQAQYREVHAEALRLAEQRDEAIKYLGGMNPGMLAAAKRVKAESESERQVREALECHSGEDTIAGVRRVKADLLHLREKLAATATALEGAQNVVGEAEQKARHAFAARDSFREELDRERNKSAGFESELRQIDTSLNMPTAIVVPSTMLVGQVLELRAENVKLKYELKNELSRHVPRLGAYHYDMSPTGEHATLRTTSEILRDENERYKAQIGDAVRTIDALREEVKKHEALEARLEERAIMAEKSEDVYKDLATKYQKEAHMYRRELLDERRKPLRVMIPIAPRCTCEKWCVCHAQSGRS